MPRLVVIFFSGGDRLTFYKSYILRITFVSVYFSFRVILFIIISYFDIISLKVTFSKERLFVT